MYHTCKWNKHIFISVCAFIYIYTHANLFVATYRRRATSRRSTRRSKHVNWRRFQPDSWARRNRNNAELFAAAFAPAAETRQKSTASQNGWRWYAAGHQKDDVPRHFLHGAHCGQFESRRRSLWKWWGILENLLDVLCKVSIKLTYEKLNRPYSRWRRARACWRQKLLETWRQASCVSHFWSWRYHVLQCIALCCCVLLCVAVCCCVLLCVAVVLRLSTWFHKVQQLKSQSGGVFRFHLLVLLFSCWCGSATIV